MLPIPQSDDKLLSYFFVEGLKGFFGGGNINDPEGRRREEMLPFILLGLIAIVCTEPFKVLLRRNIGKLSLSLPRLLLAVVLYALWGWLLFYIPSNEEYADYKTAFLASAIFYWLLAAGTLVLGCAEYFKAASKYNQQRANILLHIYRGDSLFFQVSSEAERNKAWMIKEPLCCLFFSLTLTILPMFINPTLGLVGAPLIASTLSFWFNEWFQINNVWDVVLHKVSREMAKAEQSKNNPLGETYSFVNNN